jgi:hypothetical protein
VTEQAPAAACRNCASSASGKYCPACGQETALHPPSAGEFLHEFVGHYVALEGALWRTLKALVRPGKLTVEYYEGRRRQYVLPLRLYLTASLVFFLALKAVGPVPPLPLRLGIELSAPVADPNSAAVPCKFRFAQCRTVNDYVKARYGDLTRSQWKKVLHERLVQTLPYAMFLLLPAFAALTRIAYWRRPRNYGEHLVFAFHVHAFGFLLGALVSPFGNTYLLTVPLSVYVGVALGRAFPGRDMPNVARYLAILTAYGVLIILTVFAILLATAFL